VVICLEQGADLHMAQLMPLPLTVSCFSKIQIGFTFLVPAHPGSPGKGPLNGCVCVCACVRACVRVCVCVCVTGGRRARFRFPGKSKCPKRRRRRRGQMSDIQVACSSYPADVWRVVVVVVVRHLSSDEETGARRQLNERLAAQLCGTPPTTHDQRGYIFYAGGSLAGAGCCRQCRRRPAILPLQLWHGCQVCVKISAQRLPRVAQFNAR